MNYRQDPPYCVQIEPTEGCNLRCPFCGINGIRDNDRKNLKFMTVETADRIASQMAADGWNSRIEIAMHGEPTLNPHIRTIIHTFKHYLPKAYILMESNGGGIIQDPIHKIQKLFGAGLSTLVIDEYQDIKLADKIFDKVREHYNLTTEGDFDFEDKVEVFGATYHDYPKDKNGNPHQRKSNKRLVRVRPVDVSTSGTHSNLSNHCGSGLPKNDKAVGRRCAKPFRELSFRYDGAVTICCNDWRGEMPVGNINDLSLEEIWHHERFYAMRTKMYNGERDKGACVGCDFISYRVGLLPDHKGSIELPPTSPCENKIVDQMIAEGPLTTPVLREWEK